MAIDFKSTQKLLDNIIEYLNWDTKQKERSKKVNTLKKKINERN